MTQGLAVMLISTDFEEVCQICHRALVFRGGRIAGSFHHEELTLDKLVSVASMGSPTTDPKGEPSAMRLNNRETAHAVD